MPAITVAMITLNEEAAVAKVIGDIQQAVSGLDAEILVVDSSRDRTPEIAAAMGARVLRQFPPQGYGRAMMRATSVRFFGCSMNSAAREAARTRAATCCGFFSAQLWRIASTFSAARTRMSETKCRIWPTPRSTAIEFQGAPTQNPSIWPLARLSTM